ncbi:MAG: SEC-C metal-binding domain-containing protein [Eubacteriales bacterium]
MSLYSEWTKACEVERDQKEHKAFWDTYFEAEKQNYQKILANHETVYEGKLSALAETFDMNPVVFTGFLDGINTSLKKEINMERLKETTAVNLDVDFEKLYFNMLDAKAGWLSGLSEWDDVLPAERRKAIAAEWRASKQAVSNKVGRNDPCPCGSGKKYKKCCGA